MHVICIHVHEEVARVAYVAWLLALAQWSTVVPCLFVLNIMVKKKGSGDQDYVLTLNPHDP